MESIKTVFEKDSELIKANTRHEVDREYLKENFKYLLEWLNESVTDSDKVEAINDFIDKVRISGGRFNDFFD